MHTAAPPRSGRPTSAQRRCGCRPRQCSSPPKPEGNSSPSSYGGSNPRAPDIPRHSPGRSRAGCSDTECGPGRSRPRRRRPGRSAEPWLRLEHRQAPTRAESAKSARAGRCGTGPGTTSRGGRGGVGRGCTRPWDVAWQPFALPAPWSTAPGHASPRPSSILLSHSCARRFTWLIPQVDS